MLAATRRPPVLAISFATRVLRFGCTALFLAASLARPALADIPQRLNYQGYLTNSSGQPINTAAGTPLHLTFKLYAAANGGAALYTEQQDVVVTNGVFNAQIGAVTPLTLPFDVPYYLEISIGSGPNPEVLAPRQAVASTPYSLRAGCIPGDRVGCYSSAIGTPGVDGCQAGVRVCNAAGTGFGSCEGEIGPTCGAVCANLATDPNNCGGCGVACPFGNSCTNGMCIPPAIACGNGVTEQGETCDDGNGVNGDGCSAACTVESGYQCTGTPSVCLFVGVCGNGVKEGNETCDDGNQLNGDGCSTTCQVESGYQCTGTPSICFPL
jgi:cysteine-rich repeat protein